MRLVSVADLRKNLRKHLTYAKSGKQVVIVDNKRAIAKLVPLAADDSDLELVAAGKMRMPKKQLNVDEFLKMPAPRVTGRQATQALLDDREEGL